jgi:tRNA(Phe) wybutosine-synthesizing methylase Tyw3
VVGGIPTGDVHRVAVEVRDGRMGMVLDGVRISLREDPAARLATVVTKVMLFLISPMFLAMGCFGLARCAITMLATAVIAGFTMVSIISRKADAILGIIISILVVLLRITMLLLGIPTAGMLLRYQDYLICSRSLLVRRRRRSRSNLLVDLSSRGENSGLQTGLIRGRISRQQV